MHQKFKETDQAVQLTPGFLPLTGEMELHGGKVLLPPPEPEPEPEPAPVVPVPV